MERMEKEKKDKHLKAYLGMHCHFAPLVYTMDGLAGRETRVAERCMASHLCNKPKQEYSDMVGFVRVRMVLVVLHSITLLLRGARSKQGRIRWHPDMVDQAWMALQQPWQE